MKKVKRIKIPKIDWKNDMHALFAHKRNQSDIDVARVYDIKKIKF